MTAVQPKALMSGRYQRAFTIAVVFLVAGWHLAGAGGQLLHNRSAFGSFAFQGAMWLVMALAIAAGSVLVLRGTPGWRSAWAVLARGLKTAVTRFHSAGLNEASEISAQPKPWQTLNSASAGLGVAKRSM